MKTFSDWLDGSELGAYLLAQELSFYDSMVSDVFGFRALQLGLPQHDFLRANRMPWRGRVADFGAAEVYCDPAHLPIESRSLDLIVMPHVLDFTEHPHQVLREAERVLVPEGKLVLTGFNPLSLWGVRRLIQGSEAGPWRGNFFAAGRLRDWFELLGLEPAQNGYLCYAPPFGRSDWLQRFAFMERAGERWWPLAAGVYGLMAIKRQRGMRLLTPAWKTSKAAAKLVIAGDRKHVEHGHRLTPRPPKKCSD